MGGQSARLFAREAEAYFQSAIVLHRNALATSQDPRLSQYRNPKFFLLLHSCELAIKSVAISRKAHPTNSHDIVTLLRVFSIASDRDQFRQTYRKTRQFFIDKIEGKWSENGSPLATAGREIELEEMNGKRLGIADAFRTLGALGQSEMTKLEFGEVVDKWWHGARYPRLGTTSYPDFEICKLICEDLIETAEKEVGDD